MNWTVPPAAGAPKLPVETLAPLPPLRLSVPMSAWTVPSLSSSGSMKAVAVAVVRWMRAPAWLWIRLVALLKDWMPVLAFSVSVPAFSSVRPNCRLTVPVCLSSAPDAIWVVPASRMVPADQVKVPLLSLKVPVPAIVPLVKLLVASTVVVVALAIVRVAPEIVVLPLDRGVAAELMGAAVELDRAAGGGRAEAAGRDVGAAAAVEVERPDVGVDGAVVVE